MTGMDYSQFEFTVLFLERFGLRSHIPLDKHYDVMDACYQAFLAYDECFARVLNSSSLDIIKQWLLANDDLIAKRLNEVKDK